jgi:hypothetical protein
VCIDQNRLDRTPVVPIFVAEMDQKGEYKPVNFGMQFPDDEHCRSKTGADAVLFLRFVSNVIVMPYSKIESN